jgi:hypothetical protein
MPKNQIRTRPLLKLRSRYIVLNFVRTFFVRFPLPPSTPYSQAQLDPGFRSIVNDSGYLHAI